MSLLTQFYPGPGGGGSGGVGAYAGLASAVFGGVVTMPTLAGGMPAVIGGTLYPFTTAWNMSMSSGDYEYATINNAIAFLTIPSGAAGPSEISLNGAILQYLAGAAGASFRLASLKGSGIMSFVNINPSTSSDLASISTDILFVAGTYGGTSPTISIRNAKLDATSVNHVLESMVATGAALGAAGTVDFSGGTSAGTASLTAAGTAAVAALVAAGWTVTLN